MTSKKIKTIWFWVLGIILLPYLAKVTYLFIGGYSFEFENDYKYINTLKIGDSLVVDSVFGGVAKRSTDAFYTYNIDKYIVTVHVFFKTDESVFLGVNLTNKGFTRDDFGPFEPVEILQKNGNILPVYTAGGSLELDGNIVFNVLHKDSLQFQRKQLNREVVMGTFDYMDLKKNGRLLATWDFKRQNSKAILVFEERSYAILLTIVQSRDNLQISDLGLVGENAVE